MGNNIKITIMTIYIAPIQANMDTDVPQNALATLLGQNLNVWQAFPTVRKCNSLYFLCLQLWDVSTVIQ